MKRKIPKSFAVGLNGNELNEYYTSMNGVQSVIPLCAIDECIVLGHLFIR